jgi:DNA-binding NarL/FixJ family response regulator
VAEVRRMRPGLAEAWGAFGHGDWARAREQFEHVLADAPSPDALDGLGQTLWWLGDTDGAVEHRTRAFAEYQRLGMRDEAANVAVYLAAEFRIAGNSSLANGWLGRAQRLLDGVAECGAHGWLEVELCKRARSPEEAGDHAATAIVIARRLGDSNLEASALSRLGMARIAANRIDEGLRQLDEAMAIATGGEIEDPLAISDACCTTLAACERIADHVRARDWSRAISDFMRRRNYMPLYPWCRAIYAGFLVTTGRWDEAERELESALQHADAFQNANRVAPLACLADLRVRQGRLEEAEQLLAGCEDRPAALRPVVEIDLVRGRTGLASERVEQQIAAAGGQDGLLAPLMALRARAAVAAGDAAAARSAARDLVAVAAHAGRDDLGAIAAEYAAQATRLAGEQADPRPLESAVEHLADLEMPLEEASARIELARTLRSERPALAIEQARLALGICERLGAARHADEAAALLRELGRPGRALPRTAGELTRREQEVLTLLASGLSNGDIAARLVISPRTAEHHVSRILMKLGLRNRSEAAAYAVREAGPGRD